MSPIMRVTRLPAPLLSPPNAALLLFIIGSALALPTTFFFGPPPSASTRSIYNGHFCRGSTNLEHLSGECLFHYQCVHQRGVSIGSCLRDQVVGSCCLIQDTTSATESREASSEQTNPSTARRPSSLNPISTTTTLLTTQSQTITAKVKPGTGGVVNDETQFYEIITANNRKTTTGKPKALVSITETEATSTTTATRPNATKSDKLVDIGSSAALWPQFDPSTNGWFQPAPVPAGSNPSIPNIHVEDIFSNHFPVMPSVQQSSTAAPAINHYPTLGSAPVLPSIPSTTASPQDIAHPGRYTCGVRPLRPTGRVVGGRNAAFGEWPWQVLIKESGWLGLFMKPKCGGVLIDDRWILTAAHCQPGVMGSLVVMLGQHEMNGENQQLKPVVKTVRRMIVHRDYNSESFDNDIALLELDTPFELKPHVVPICLPDSDYNLVGEFAHIAGFGKLSYGFLSRLKGGQMPSILQTVKLPIIANGQCQKMFADAGHFKYIRDSFLCAGYPQGGKDSCEGDSGSPLMIEKNGVWTLVGTVSHGIKCAEPNMPGVYMKTFAYLGWIRSIIGRK